VAERDHFACSGSAVGHRAGYSKVVATFAAYISALFRRGVPGVHAS